MSNKFIIASNTLRLSTVKDDVFVANILCYYQFYFPFQESSTISYNFE